MTITQVVRIIWLAAISVPLLTLAALACPPSVDNPSIEGALRPDRNFFEDGREQFELQVEQLQQPESEAPILTLDESVLFDPDAQEAYPEIQPGDLEQAVPNAD